ncbi:phosphoserine phosphatase SerB [Colwellia sp. TT2012]|uniref:phosphoserine phosphatase SerB n=1 Tax=Colwellia sp. TT2012 TaxID=1720342 RepID=UPI00070B79C9|nr:phosphoserine phosphatase SerB [Colwellia sp. TT2012]
MSFIANVLPLSLAQYLAQNLQDKRLPIAFDLSEQALNLDKHPLGTSSAQDKIELVVFQQLTLAQLLAIQSKVKLEIISLTTINHRNNQTSCRFQVNCADFIQARKALADFTLANKVEAALLSQVPRLSEPGLLVMDMDSTTIAIECIDEIAKLAGVGEEVAAVTERAMLGELDFAQSLHQRVATLAGAPISILSDVAKDLPLMAGLKPLITELKKHNWRIAIASGGFTYFADHLKETLNLDAAFANTLEIIDGKLTGKVLGDVVDAQVKADSLAILSKKYNIPKSQTVAMGDGANDLVMMAAASFGVAFHAKTIVLAQADSSINVQGLDCLLHWLA